MNRRVVLVSLWILSLVLALGAGLACSSGEVSGRPDGSLDGQLDGTADGGDSDPGDSGGDPDGVDDGGDGSADGGDVTDGGGDPDGLDDGGDEQDGYDGDDGSDGDSDGGSDGGPQVSEVPLRAQVLAGGEAVLLSSNGVPFGPGVVFSTDDLALFQGATEIPVSLSPLANWQDGSLRSVLLQFQLAAGEFPTDLVLKVGQARQTNDLSPVAVDWTLSEAVAFPDGQYLAASFVAGPLVPVGAQPWMATYDSNQRDNYEALKGDADWGPDCRYDGYYSTTHAWYQLFARTGDVEVYSWARREMVHYRDDQIVASGDDAGTMNGRSEPRYLYLKAMETDYLLSGDSQTLQVAKLMADYLLGGWDPSFFFYAHDDESFWTERRAAFALMGLVVYGRFSGEQAYLQAASPRLDQLLLTQAQWPDGGWIHHLYAHDTEECSSQGSYGGSPFMTGLLFEALRAWHLWTPDSRIVDAVSQACDWLWDEGWDSDGFTYMIGCPGESDWTAPDLNLLIAHGFAFAWHHTGEQRFYDRAMVIFEQGVANAYLGTRKHYNQNHRTSGAFLYYMSQPPVVPTP